MKLLNETLVQYKNSRKSKERAEFIPWQHDNIKLRNCRNVNDVLYIKNKLWIFKSQLIKFLQKVYHQFTNDHFDKNCIIESIKQFYYSLRLKGIVERYICNCDFCQRSKISRDKINNLLTLLFVLKQRWQDSIMNFIINLFSVDRYKIIYIIIDHLIKERYYIFCWNEEQGLSAKKVAHIVIWNVFRLHGLFDTIVLNKDFQLISIIWKHMYVRRRIKVNLSIICYFLIDE